MCKVKTCNKKARTRGYCPGHYDRLRRNNDLNESKPLSVRNIPHMDKQGYMQYRKNGKRIFEHREVMEKHIGRQLFPHEKIHHINGNRADNRIENLEIWSSSQPSGQRVEDKVKWALEILETYKDFSSTQKEVYREESSKTPKSCCYCCTETGDGIVSEAKETVRRIVALCGTSESQSKFGPQHGSCC